MLKYFVFSLADVSDVYKRQVQSQYNLGGTLDTSGAFTGKTGKNIAGIEIRVFEGNVESSPGGDLSGGEVAPSLSYMIGDKTKWTSFNKMCIRDRKPSC